MDVDVSGYLPFGAASAAGRDRLRPGSVASATASRRQRRQTDEALLQFIYSRPLPLRRALSADPRTAKTLPKPAPADRCDFHIKVPPIFLFLPFDHFSSHFFTQNTVPALSWVSIISTSYCFVFLYVFP